MVDALRVAFFGTPQFAVPTLRALIESRHTVCGVVTQPDKPRGRGQQVSDSPVKALAVEHRLPVLQPTRLRDPAFVEALRAWHSDIGIVAAYGRLIPDDILAVPRLGMINVHASLLPKYRGAAPIQRAIIDGEAVTGVTIMRVETLLDAGEMLAKVTRPIGPDETSDVVERSLATLGADLLMQVLEQIAAGTERGERQDFMLATFAPRITRDEGVVDWSLPALYIHNRVRALHPWPHATTTLEGARVIILKTRVHDGPSGAAPGTIVDVGPDGIHVAAGHGSRIVIEQLQPEGRRAMSAREFAAGRRIRAGMSFR
jgi:methionyl-tRNA formyltransferase